ncbi:MAG: discoidin domain-containing protein [Bacteroidota bacterium]
MRGAIIKIVVLILALLSLAIQIFAQPKLLDDFNSVEGWRSFSTEGVVVNVSVVDGFKGKCIKLDYNFTKGSGYFGIQSDFPIQLPDNYQFTFYVRAESPNNNFETKFLDKSGANVWWVNRRNYEFPTEWTKLNVKKRHINFAWGPTQDQTLRSIDKIEFTVASYNGGKGTVYIDELFFEELPGTGAASEDFLVEASSTSPNSNTSFLTNNKLETIWLSDEKEKQEIIFDFKGSREYGGLIIRWDEKDFAKKFNVCTSNDKINWDKVYSVSNNNAGNSFIRLNEYESAFIKLELVKSSKKNGYGIKEIELKKVDWSADINRFFINVASEYPRGYYPRYLNSEKSYWTVIGVNNDVKEAMMNEDGMVEVDKLNFSIEPFLYYDKKLVTWNDAQTIQSLENNYLPIPQVKWLDDVQLTTKAFASGEANKSSVLFLSYTVKNVTKEKKSGNLFLALRPFQVNPYYQELNITGGSAKVKTIEYRSGRIKINGDKEIIPISKLDGFGSATFDEGNIVAYLSKNELPAVKNVKDNFGYASGAMKFSFSLKPQEEKTFYVAVPFYKNYSNKIKSGNFQYVVDELNRTIKFWDEKVSHIKFHLPSSADKIINTIKSNLAYILVNRDKAGIQPGSRSYERSWIRDGALTSSALLKNGIVKEVHDFIEWYSANQFENGKVPCVVDRRGPDPVPENDSHGEFIYLIKTYFDYTKDTTFLRSKFENVKRAFGYLEELIAQRSTDFYKNSGDSILAYYGILPESISHEGYSAKPMHSYWDSFWGMKGLKDAVKIAEILGETEEAERMTIVRDEFKKNLYNSIELATLEQKIDFIPGCVELGDFDATSTTIALYPCGEINNLPQKKLENTFDKYFEFSKDRAEGKKDWEAYTPYEMRTIGSFILMDQIKRAHYMTEYFLKDQRPSGWNHWAEVVWKDKRLPRFIGDMPHTWVGSDFVNSMRMMFVYENEYDSTIVVGAGLYQEWIDSPETIKIENLPTYYGELSYAIGKNENMYVINLYGNINLPKGGLVIKNFNGKQNPAKVVVNGAEATDFTNDKIYVKTFPATVLVYY